MLVSDGTGRDYLCRRRKSPDRKSRYGFLRQRRRGESPSRIWLFQGLPKSDKMEFIIQKAVELGAAGIVPVSTRNTVVKLDPKKGRGQGQRWQAIGKRRQAVQNGAWFPGYPAL